MQIKIHFKNIGETSPVIEGMHIRKATGYQEDVTLQKQCVPSHCYSGGAGQCAQDKHGLKAGSGAQKQCWIFTAHAQKCRKWCWTEGLRCRFSCLLSTARWTKPQNAAQDLQSSGLDQPLHELSLPHWDDPFWKKNRLFLNQKRRLHRRKRYSRRNGRKKTYSLGIMSQKINANEILK